MKPQSLKANDGGTTHVEGADTMTAIQIYGLVAPLVLAGCAWIIVEWQLRVIEKHRRGAGQVTGAPPSKPTT